MKTQTTVLIVITIIVMQCKKQNTTTLSADKKPTVSLVSTTARLLDTVWSAPKRYMHFMITFDVVAGDSDIYFSQLPIDYQSFVKFLGPDTGQIFTPYRPLVIPDVPEIIPEGDIFKISAGDTVQIRYFGMLIAHGPWIQFYMQAYGFPYSNGSDDGIYESILSFDNPFTTDMAR
jgi:hypothetical protein